MPCGFKSRLRQVSRFALLCSRLEQRFGKVLLSLFGPLWVVFCALHAFFVDLLFDFFLSFPFPILKKHKSLRKRVEEKFKRKSSRDLEEIKTDTNLKWGWDFYADWDIVTKKKYRLGYGWDREGRNLNPLADHRPAPLCNPLVLRNRTQLCSPTLHLVPLQSTSYPPVFPES
jgi:hypothetical protein